MRPRPWGWSPEGRRRYGVLLLLLGHLFWILLGRGGAGRWERVLAVLSWPGRGVSAKLHAWRVGRLEQARNFESTRQELAQARQQLETLQLQRAQEAPRIAEAEEAIRMLGLKRQLPLELKAARVIADLRRAPFGGMILDQGEDAALVADQGVIVPEGVVGRVWSVAPHQASLLPLDAYNASTAVMLARSRATGVLQGVGPNRAEIRYIPRQEVVQVGEPVFTSGLDRVFPRGLLVGFVSSVRPRENELHLEVNLAARLERVHQVLILPPKPQVELAPPAPPPQEKKARPAAKGARP